MNVLCSGNKCHTQAAQIAHLTQQLATARAQLAQAQAEAREWQDAYAGAVESAAFHLAGFEQATRKAVRA